MTRKGFAGLRSDRSSKHHSFLSPYTSSCRILRTKTRETERGTGNGDVLMCFLGVCIPIHTYSTDIHVHVLYIYICIYVSIVPVSMPGNWASKQASKLSSVVVEFVRKDRRVLLGCPFLPFVPFSSRTLSFHADRRRFARRSHPRATSFSWLFSFVFFFFTLRLFTSLNFFFFLRFEWFIFFFFWSSFGLWRVRSMREFGDTLCMTHVARLFLFFQFVRCWGIWFELSELVKNQWSNDVDKISSTNSTRFEMKGNDLPFIQFVSFFFFLFRFFRPSTVHR